jgi:hypothetical protein
MNQLSKIELKFTVYIVLAALLFNIVHTSFSSIFGCNAPFVGKQVICTVFGIKYMDTDPDGQPIGRAGGGHCDLCLINSFSLDGLLPVAIAYVNSEFNISSYLSFDWVRGFVFQPAFSYSLSRAPPFLYFN